MYVYLTDKDFNITVHDEEIQVDVNIVPLFYCLLMLLFLHAIFAKQAHIE